MIKKKDSNCDKIAEKIANSISFSTEEITALLKTTETEEWTFTVGENSVTSQSLDKLCWIVELNDWWIDANFNLVIPLDSLPDQFD